MVIVMANTLAEFRRSVNGRFGSVPDAQYSSVERLVWRAYRPLRVDLEKTAVLSVCFHQERPLSG
jgi:hypothetical protein